MSLNIFKGYYAPMKYPSSWVANIKMFFKSCKWAYQRAKRGYADRDIWSFDSYLTEIMENGIRELAANSHTYPGTREFPTPESWASYLSKIADLLHNSREDTDAYSNIYEADYVKWILEHGLNSKNPWSEAYLVREKEIQAKRQHDFDEAWDMIHHVYNHLWD